MSGAQVVAELLFDLVPVERGGGGDGEQVVGGFLEGELFVGGGQEGGGEERGGEDIRDEMHGGTDCIIRQVNGDQRPGAMPRSHAFRPKSYFLPGEYGVSGHFSSTK